jgi:uncharacterized protein (DUF302 family)
VTVITTGLKGEKTEGREAKREAMTTSYGISKTVSLPYEIAIDRITEELKKEGFGVLTTIDVKETLKKKLDVDFQKYVILGACNPPFAHKALLAEEQIGLLLPCNVIVYEKEGRTVIAAFDPLTMVTMVENEALKSIAEEIGRKLRRVINAVA